MQEAKELRIVRAANGRVQRLLQELRVNGPPKCLVARYGPIGMQTSRRVGEVGFEGLATLVDTTAYLVPNYPNKANPRVGDEGPFTCTEVNMSAEFSWTYTSAPGYAGGAPVNTKPAAGLYDSALTQNGGAIILNNFSGTGRRTAPPDPQAAPVHPRIGVELDIIDKTRGRSFTPNGRISNEVFTGLTYGFKEFPETTFPIGTEIEPRLYVTECRMTDALDTTTPFNAASVAVWVTLIFKGFIAGRRR